MTNVVSLAESLFRRIQWQNVPEDVTKEDLSVLIADAIRYLYIVTGRTMQFDDSMFSYADGMCTSFSQDTYLDEKEYILVTAEIAFYRKVQSGVSDLTSYTTDAMSVTHGDKPFANLEQKLQDLEKTQNIIWHKMIRYNLL